MSVAPETLDTIMCSWCADSGHNKRAIVVAVAECYAPEFLCSTHCQEIASEHLWVNIYPVTNKPEYTTLETEATPMSGEWTINQLEQAARYGAPYPVCGDLTTRKRVGKSWVGHDPSGEQY